jgi:nucleoside-diphosphate-sugar epimerase
LLGLFAKSISENSKVIFVSTTSVYPESLFEATEDYSWSKEDLLKETVLAEIELTKNLRERLTILRLAGLIGPNRHPVRFLAGKENLPNGNSPVNLIHLEDVIGLIEKIVKEKYWGEIVNGCFPSHPTRKEYYQNAAIELNLNQPLFQESSEIGKLVKSEKSISHLNYIYSKSIFDLD